MVSHVESGSPGVQITPPQQITQRTLTLLERQVDDAIARRASAVEILLGAVQVFDSAGLNWLVNARSRLDVAGIPLKLIDPSPLIHDVFIATRLDSRFTFVISAGSGDRNA
jgi:anti-anti-sigma factor